MTEQAAAPSFSDETINGVLTAFFGRSTPGDEMHHFVLGVLEPTALGVPTGMGGRVDADYWPFAHMIRRTVGLTW